MRETNVGTYNTFWKIRKIFISLFDEVTNHWGQQLNLSTKKWMEKEFIKRLKHENLDFIPSEKILACLDGISSEAIYELTREK